MFIACHQNFTFDHIVVVPSINVGWYQHLIPAVFDEAIMHFGFLTHILLFNIKPLQGLVAYDTLFHGLGLKARYNSAQATRPGY